MTRKDIREVRFPQVDLGSPDINRTRATGLPTLRDMAIANEITGRNNATTGKKVCIVVEILHPGKTCGPEEIMRAWMTFEPDKDMTYSDDVRRKTAGMGSEKRACFEKNMVRLNPRNDKSVLLVQTTK